MELTQTQTEELVNESIEEVVRDVEMFYATIELRPDYAQVMQEVENVCKRKRPT